MAKQNFLLRSFNAIQRIKLFSTVQAEAPPVISTAFGATSTVEVESDNIQSITKVDNVQHFFKTSEIRILASDPNNGNTLLPVKIRGQNKRRRFLQIANINVSGVANSDARVYIAFGDSDISDGYILLPNTVQTFDTIVPNNEIKIAIDQIVVGGVQDPKPTVRIIEGFTYE